ncbi:tailspike protein [Bacillus phage Silence]|nr:tailspike protein [Bacillus phage Silence]
MGNRPTKTITTAWDNNNRNNMEQNRKDVSQGLDELQNQIDNLIIGSGSSSAEVIQARQTLEGTTAATLNERINNDISYLNRKQKNQFADIVEDYKVKKDTLSNASSIFQTAINETAALGIWLVVPAGSYHMEKELIAKSGLKMILHKDAKMIRYHDNCMMLNGVTGDSAGGNDIIIDGGQWDLQGDTILFDGSAFAFGYAKNIIIRNLKVYDVYFSHGMEICAIDGARVEYCEGYGFKDDTGTRTTAEFIQIEAGTSAGFPYFGPGNGNISKNIDVTGCKTGPSGSLPAWNVGLGSHATQTVYGGDVIRVSKCDFTTVETGMQITGYTNVTLDKIKINSKKGVKISFDNATKTNVVLRDMVIKATSLMGVHMDGVKGITFEHCDIDGYTNAIYGTNTTDVNINSNCDLSGQTSDTIAIITYAKNVKVRDSIIRKAGRHAFNIYDNSSNFRIRDCEIIDVTNVVFNLAGSNTKNIIIEGNNISDASLTNVLAATAGVDRLYFNKNFYPSTISTPINSVATNSDVTGNIAI